MSAPRDVPGDRGQVPGNGRVVFLLFVQLLHLLELDACAEHFRQSPNGLFSKKETTPGIVRWTRVDGVPLPFKTRRARDHVDLEVLVLGLEELLLVGVASELELTKIAVLRTDGDADPVVVEHRGI